MQESQPINIDANGGGDWPKRTFDIMVDTAEEYAEGFGLDTADKIRAHINARVGTPYWSGVPLEIKAGLVRIANSMKQ
jgi:hypothetical protein